MSIWSKFLAIAAAAFMSVGFATVASATPVESYLENGVNTLEDDSGELVFRWDGTLNEGRGGFAAVLDGNIAAGDIVLGVLDITSVNAIGTNFLEPGHEVTGIYAGVITGFDVLSGSGQTEIADLTFGALSADQLTAFGISGAVGETLWLFSDSSANGATTDLHLDTDTTSAAFANATDGTLILAGALDANSTNGDFFFGTNVQTALSQYTGGQSSNNLRGSFVGGLSMTQYYLPGEFIYCGVMTDGKDGFNEECYDIVISGSLHPGTDLDYFGVANDAQIQFNRIPEPGTLGILGMGLLGMAAAGRRRRS